MILGIILGIAIGVLVIVLADTIVYNNSHYTGGHAAGRVHHKRSWEDQKLENKQEFDEKVNDEDLLDAIVQGLRAAVKGKPKDKVPVEDTVGDV